MRLSTICKRAIICGAATLLLCVGPADPASAAISLEINVNTGLGRLHGENDLTSGYDIASPSGSLVPDDWTSITDKEAGWLEISTTEELLSEGTLGTAYLLDGYFSLGTIFDEENGSEDLVFTYLDENSMAHDGDVSYVPEPATLALLVAGLVGWAGRRAPGRKRRR